MVGGIKKQAIMCCEPWSWHHCPCDEPHQGPEIIRGHISWGRVCFLTEEELHGEKHFLIHRVVTFPVGRKQVYKSGVKIAVYYIKEHTHTPKIRNSPQIHSQPALHKGKECKSQKQNSGWKSSVQNVFNIDCSCDWSVKVFPFTLMSFYCMISKNPGCTRSLMAQTVTQPLKGSTVRMNTTHHTL